MSSGVQSPPVRDHSIREPQVDGFFRRTQLQRAICSLRSEHRTLRAC
jgi:hypothetical protein